MPKVRNRLKQTVALVEERIQNRRSDDPLKDLAFLSEHYKSKHEWDKANAATRHMLAVAEGNESSTFEITPIDIELHQSRKLWRQRTVVRHSFIAVSIVAGILSIVAASAAISDRLKSEPKLMLDAKVQPFNRDPQNFIDRATYYRDHLQFSAALADCERALSIAPKNEAALELKSYILMQTGDHAGAFRAIDLMDHAGSDYRYTKSALEFLCGQYRSAAPTMENISAPNSYQESFVAYSYARSGDFSKALQAAQAATMSATTDTDRAYGYTDQARYLLRLSRYNEAIGAASHGIDYGNRPQSPSERKYSVLSLAYTYRAEALYQNGAYQSARDDASKALAVDRYNYRAYTIRAKIFDQMGLTSDAAIDRGQAELCRTDRDL